MADIELVIKIPKGLKNDFESEQWTALSCMEMKDALEKAITLPKGHDKLIDVGVLKKELIANEWITNYDGGGLEDLLDNALTIIEADTESEG